MVSLQPLCTVVRERRILLWQTGNKISIEFSSETDLYSKERHILNRSSSFLSETLGITQTEREMTTPLSKSLQHFSLGWMGSLHWDFYLSDNDCERKGFVSEFNGYMKEESRALENYFSRLWTLLYSTK
ncbi:hypothetical protein QQF64_020822 [Cirrhinus molitorella]|uniref:Uncharacterized protein n=1 Tax=Cirrhinus molitorella TaxID=172907 RepID=A0ABR3LAA8_9TELE